MKEHKRQHWVNTLEMVDKTITELRREEEALAKRQHERKGLMMSVEQAVKSYGQAVYLHDGQIPAYTQLPVLQHTRSLSQHLGFVSLALKRSRHEIQS